MYRFFGNGFSDTFQLKQDAAALDNGDEVVRSALAFAHGYFTALFGDDHVGKNPNPHLAAALNVLGNHPASSFNLAGGNPARLQRFQSVAAE